MLRDDGGEPVAFVATFKDITARKQAEERLHELAREHAALARVAAAVAHERDPAEIFALVAEEAGELFDMDGAGVARFDGEEALIMSAWGSSGTPLALAGKRFPLTEGTASAIVNTSGRPARVGREARGSGHVARELTGIGVLKTVAAPVVVAGAVWGSISVARTTDEPIAAGVEERLAALRRARGLAIANADEPQPLVAQRADRPADRACSTTAPSTSACATRPRARAAHGPRALPRRCSTSTASRTSTTRTATRSATRCCARSRRRWPRSRARRATLRGPRSAATSSRWLLPGADADEAPTRPPSASRRAVARASPSTPGGVADALGRHLRARPRPTDAGELLRLADGALYWAKAHGRDVSSATRPRSSRSSRPPSAPSASSARRR